MEQPNEAAQRARNRRRVKQGRVASDKMDKTIVVVTETRVPHAVYQKIVRQFACASRRTTSRTKPRHGDLVRIAECRPLSQRQALALARDRRTGEIGRFEHDSARDATQGRRQ